MIRSTVEGIVESEEAVVVPLVPMETEPSTEVMLRMLFTACEQQVRRILPSVIYTYLRMYVRMILYVCTFHPGGYRVLSRR